MGVYVLALCLRQNRYRKASGKPVQNSVKIIKFDEGTHTYRLKARALKKRQGTEGFLQFLCNSLKINVNAVESAILHVNI